jgi:hypothetical protein
MYHPQRDQTELNPWTCWNGCMVHSDYFSASNQLLSAGRKSHEAAKMCPDGGIPLFQGRKFKLFPWLTDTHS